METYRELLSGFPTVGKVAEELERIVLGIEEKEEAYLLLKPLLEAQQEWERLLVCMEAYRESLEEVERRIGLTGQMTDVAELRLEDRTRAFFLAVQALEMAPGRGELADRLEGIGRAAGLLEQVVDSYGAIAAREGNEEYQGVLLTRKAEVLKNEVQDFYRAIAEYEKLRELSPERSVLAALDELYAVVENWEKLASVLREEIDAAATPGEKMPFYFRLAELMEDRLGDAARACEVLKEAHLLDPQDGEALFRLRRVYDEKVGDEEAADLDRKSVV